MRIVIATAVYYPMTNGVAVFSHNLAVGLARRGHDVLVLCPSQTGKKYTRVEEGVTVTRLKSVDIKVYPDQIHAVPAKKRFFGINLPRFWYKKGLRVSVFPAREIRKSLDKFHPDVVHVQVSDPIGLSVVSYARKNGVPVVTTEHNQPEVLTGSFKLPGVVKRPINGMLSAYFRNRQSKSDFVTMPTRQAIENLILSHNKEFPVPVAAVSNGVDLTNFRPGCAEKTIYHKYGIDDKLPTVLYVGRVDPEKQVGLVLEAFKKARKDLPKIQLVVVGDGVDLPRLKKLAEKLGVASEVRFLGRVLPPDLYELYKIGSVFVTASEIETQGIVLIEAAATGLPLVAVSAGAVGEVCQNNINGFLCEPGNVSEIADGIIRILGDKKLRDKFSANSLKIAKEHDFETTLDRFINIYQKIIAK